MGSYQQVNVLVEDRKPPYDPVPAVLVRVYSVDGKKFFTESETDPYGKAGFLLYTQEYSFRFFKFQVSFRQPQLFTVLEGVEGAPLLNEFGIQAEIVAPPVANDPRLCRASGYFRDITGAPHRNLDIIFIGEFAPILLEGSGVLSERRMVKTDEKGYVQVDLIRCANYSVTIEGMEDRIRSVSVPDAPSVNLPDLLFPVVGSVSFSPSGLYNLRVGETLSLTPTVATSSGVPLTGTAKGDVKWSLLDDTVASLSVGRDELTVTGLKAGSTELKVERLDQTIIRILDTPIEGSGQEIVVT